MVYFDLHSDTLYEAYHKKVSPFSGNSLSAPVDALSFANYRVLAVWSDQNLSDEEAYQDFFRILSHYNVAQGTRKTPSFCTPILAVEDARLLAGDLSRLDTLYAHGVRILTLTWQDTSCIGGAWNTSEGLTRFGKDAVEKALSLGMAIDLSHASDTTFWQALDICHSLNSAPMASHSNSRTLCHHKRCLTDDMFRAITALGGIIGVSFVPYHLSNQSSASRQTVLSHIKHFLSLGGEDAIAIGSDFDGVDSLPQGLEHITRIEDFAECLAKETSSEIAEKILWQNAHRYTQTFFHN
ncbi:MAG: membrane dipeptidase [Clostridia bacterium]|nr:membrane dipeptidase [Clostridia bacterium]